MSVNQIVRDEMFFSAESPQRGFSVPPLAVCEKKKQKEKEFRACLHLVDREACLKSRQMF